MNKDDYLPGISQLANLRKKHKEINNLIHIFAHKALTDNKDKHKPNKDQSSLNETKHKINNDSLLMPIMEVEVKRRKQKHKSNSSMRTQGPKFSLAEEK